MVFVAYIAALLTGVPAPAGVGTSSAAEAIFGLEDALAVTTASVSTPQVVVTAGRMAQPQDLAPASVEVIASEELRTSGAESVAEILETQPGVQVDRTFRGAGVRLQGLDPKHVLVLVDGRRVAGRVDGTLDVQRLALDNVARIEVLKGASSALYGSDALGGVVNIITQAPQTGTHASGHAAIGSLATYDVSGTIQHATKTYGAHLSAGFHRADAYSYGGVDPATVGSAQQSANLATQARLNLVGGLRLRAQADLQYRTMDGRDLGPLLPSGTRANYLRQNRTWTGRAALGADYSRGAHRLRVDAQFSGFSDAFRLDQVGRDGAASLDSAQFTRDAVGEVNLQWDSLIAPAHLLTVGIVGLHERLSSERLSLGSAQRSRVAAFAQHEWTPLSQRLTFVPGLRATLSTDSGLIFSPKLALRFAPGHGLTLRASYGRGFRAPGFRELLLTFENPSAGYVVVGNPELAPESSHGINAGVTWAPVRDLQFHLQGHLNWVQDLISIASTAPGASGLEQFSYTNIGSARTGGLEARMSYRVSRSLDLGLGYTLLHAKDLQTGRELEGRARHRVGGHIRAGRPSWGLFSTLRAAWVSSRPYYPSQTPPTTAPAYLDLRLRVDKTVGDHATVFVGADNLLSAGDPNYLQIPPRAFYAGLDAQI